MSAFSNGFMVGWQQGRAHQQLDAEREAELRRPLNLAAMNPPEMMRPVKVRVLKPFYVAGKALQVGDIIELPAFDARSLAAIGKCELAK